MCTVVKIFFMRASEVNFKIAKILKMCKYQSLSFYVPLGAVLQISGGISHQRRRSDITQNFEVISLNSNVITLISKELSLFDNKIVKRLETPF